MINSKESPVVFLLAIVIISTLILFLISKISFAQSVNTPAKPPSLILNRSSVTPDNEKANSGDMVTLSYVVPEDVVSTSLMLYCPEGVIAKQKRVDLCNKWVSLGHKPHSTNITLYSTANWPQYVIPNFYVYYEKDPNFAIGVTSQITVLPTPVDIPTNPISDIKNIKYAVIYVYESADTYNPDWTKIKGSFDKVSAGLEKLSKGKHKVEFDFLGAKKINDYCWNPATLGITYNNGLDTSYAQLPGSSFDIHGVGICAIGAVNVNCPNCNVENQGKQGCTNGDDILITNSCKNKIPNFSYEGDTEFVSFKQRLLREFTKFPDQYTDTMIVFGRFGPPNTDERYREYICTTVRGLTIAYSNFALSENSLQDINTVVDCSEYTQLQPPALSVQYEKNGWEILLHEILHSFGARDVYQTGSMFGIPTAYEEALAIDPNTSKSIMGDMYKACKDQAKKGILCTREQLDDLYLDLYNQNILGWNTESASVISRNTTPTSFINYVIKSVQGVLSSTVKTITSVIKLNPSPSPSPTPSAIISSSPSITPKVSPLASPSVSPSPSTSVTATPRASTTASPNPSPSITPIISPTPTSTIQPSVSPSPSSTPRPSSTPSPTPVVTPALSPTPSPTPTPSATQVSTPTPSPSSTPSSSPSPIPSATPVATPSSSPTPVPTTTPAPSNSPTPSPFGYSLKKTRTASTFEAYLRLIGIIR